MNTNPETPLSMESTHHWEKSHFILHSPTSGKTSRVEGWKVRITNAKHLLPLLKFPMHYEEIYAFVTPSSHIPWVGPNQDIYLVKGDAVTGVRFSPDLGLQFCPSLVSKANPHAKSLETLKLYIAKEVDYQVAGSYDFASDLKTGKRIIDLIDLREIFKKHLFYDGSSGGSDEFQRLVSLKILDGVLKVDLERHKGRETGTVWIRLADRTLIRAVENGVQVFPAETK